MPDYRETVEKLRDAAEVAAHAPTNLSARAIYKHALERALTLLTEQEAELAALRSNRTIDADRLSTIDDALDAMGFDGLDIMASFERAMSELATLRDENARWKLLAEIAADDDTLYVRRGNGGVLGVMLLLSDFFSYASADGEYVPEAEWAAVRAMSWDEQALWAVRRRGRLPIPPVLKKFPAHIQEAMRQAAEQATQETTP